MRFVPGVHLLSATNSASFANRTYPLPISVTTYGRVLYGSGLSLNLSCASTPELVTATRATARASVAPGRT